MAQEQQWPDAIIIERRPQDDPIRPLHYYVLDGTQSTDFSNARRYELAPQDGEVEAGERLAGQIRSAFWSNPKVQDAKARPPTWDAVKDALDEALAGAPPSQVGQGLSGADRSWLKVLANDLDHAESQGMTFETGVAERLRRLAASPPGLLEKLEALLDAKKVSARLSQAPPDAADVYADGYRAALVEFQKAIRRLIDSERSGSE